MAEASEQSIDKWFMDSVLPHEGALERFIYRNWHDSSDVADIRQEVYARVYSSAQKQRPKSAKPFLFKVARNLIIDLIRRSKVVQIEAVMDMDNLYASAEELAPENHASVREELRSLETALHKLPPRCREVFVMRKVHGFSQKETAAKLGIAEATVEKHLSAGVRQLAAILGENTLQTSKHSQKGKVVEKLL